MQLSAKKQRNMTQLEVEAQNIINETGSCGSDDIEVTDDIKYEQLLESRKARRTVIVIFVVNFF
jgi:hypothetical protein